MDYKEKCSKIKHLADIEDIVPICLSCSLQLSCQIWYLVQTKKRAAVFDRCRESKKADLNSKSIVCSNESTVCCKDSDKPNSVLIHSILRRSTLKTKPASDEAGCNFCETKKVVRFADALGLELVKTSEILNSSKQTTALYKIEDSSDDSDTSDTNASFYENKTYSSNLKHNKGDINTFIFDNIELKLNVMFTQPCLNANFFVLLNEQKVILENLHISDKWINGIVRVLNVSFSKVVFMRYTVNNWLTYKDTFASYITNSCDGLTDRFSLRFCIEDDIIREMICEPVNERILFKIQFAICFQSESNFFWDNNNKENYAIECSYIRLTTE